MQTFLPSPSFRESAQCLDNKRLVKQILECGQILGALDPKAYEIIFMKPKTGSGWTNHPAVRMWSITTDGEEFILSTGQSLS
jgi:hypothetical protein